MPAASPVLDGVRFAARDRLLSVAAGAPVVPLSSSEEPLVCSAAMRLLRPSSAPSSLVEAVEAFSALLAHPDLSPRSLERLANDGPMGALEVFDVFVAHPGCTPFLLVEAALTSWEQLGDRLPSSGPLAELVDRARGGGPGRPDLLSRLPALGLPGRVAALLLPSRGRDTLLYFRDVYALLEVPSPVLEVALTLLEDSLRSQAMVSFVPDVPAALERARLLLPA